MDLDLYTAFTDYGIVSPAFKLISFLFYFFYRLLFVRIRAA